MKITFFGVLTLILLIPTLVNAELEPAIIPKPTSLKRTKGEFVLPSAIVISSNSFEDSKYAVAFLKDKLEKNTASQVKTVFGDKKAGTIKFLLVSTTEAGGSNVPKLPSLFGRHAPISVSLGYFFISMRHPSLSLRCKCSTLYL